MLSRVYHSMTRLYLVVLAVLSLFPASAGAQTTFPATPAAVQLSGWLTAFNSHDRATLLAYFQKNGPDRVSRVDDEIAFGARTGGFDLRKVQDCTEISCNVLVQEHNSDQFAVITVEVDPAPPHAIKKMRIEAVPRPPEFAIPRMTESEAISALSARLDEETKDGKFSGTAIVAKDGKPVFTGAYGMADREKKIPNTLDTKFRIGSMNKMFTATAIVQLAQAGKLQLSDPLIKYLPDYPNKSFASKVTLHQLLTHTGGAGDIFGPEFDQHRLELRTLEDYVKLYGSREPTFEPGTQWDYANYGFILLGVVVEKASGQDYYQYVRDHIFKPAGMNSTDSLPEDQPVANRSVGYMESDDHKSAVPNDPTLPYRGTSAGGGYSTVGDLLAFANALESHKLLDAEHTELLTTGKVDTKHGPKYAYGFFDETSPDGERCFGHGGGAPGMNGELRICTKSGYTIAVLANMDPQAATSIAEFIESRLPIR
jgi:D-alanyl-D-alanine carboxypeptidase